ncbi:amidohydrolase [Cetobacterium ceti]
MNILFKNVNIVTMDKDNSIIQNGFLAVENDKISYIGEKRPLLTFEREIDGKNNVLMPGLINCHTHIPMSILRGYADDYDLQEWLFNYIFKAEAKIDNKCIELGATLSIAEMLRTGTTSITDMYFNEPIVAQVVAQTGIRGNLCNGSFCFENKYDYTKDKNYYQFLEMINKYHNFDNGRIKIDVGIHGEYTSIPEFWKFWANQAIKNDLNIHLHLSETSFEHENCKKKYGKTPTEILAENNVFKVKTNLAHCVWLEKNDIRFISEHNGSICHNPVSNLKLASGIADITLMLDSGANICLGTDGVASNNTHDLFEEIKLAAILAKGKHLNAKVIPAIEVLKMATINGAKAQNRPNLGQLIVGFEADLILIDFNNISHTPTYDIISSLVYNTIGRDVLLTMVQGKILYENGKFYTIDISNIQKEINDYVLPIINS